MTNIHSAIQNGSSNSTANERSLHTHARRGHSLSGPAGLVVLLASLCAPWPASGVILWSTGDPTYNTTEPTGALAGSGWQYEGHWGSFLGTPIAPRYFVTAKHVGGAVGDMFTYQGISYTTVAYYDDPGSDLRIWKVNGLFPAFAPLYTASDELGKSLVVIGRGTQRGEPIYNEVPLAQASPAAPATLQLLLCGKAPAKSTAAKGGAVKRATATSTSATTPVASSAPATTSTTTSAPAPATEPATATPAPTTDTTTTVTVSSTPIVELKGWQWGACDGVMRWGENQVDAVIPVGGSVGDLLRAAFDANAGPNEAHLSSGDSGGAVFINDGTAWKLAGINYAVDGPYKTSPSGTPFYGAIFDVCGLYLNTYLLPEEQLPVPSNFYATRISARLAWIQSVISQP